MIVLLNTIFITLLFSFWVWTLKQDIEEMKHAQGNRTAEEPDPVMAHRTVHHATPAMAHAGGNVKRNRNGVPTWTIG